MWKAGFEPGVF